LQQSCAMNDLHAPLAERMRPRSFDELVGQPHFTAPDSGLRQALKQQKPPSLILWGPPGVGKTTIAQIIATESGKPFLRTQCHFFRCKRGSRSAGKSAGTGWGGAFY